MRIRLLLILLVGLAGLGADCSGGGGGGGGASSSSSSASVGSSGDGGGGDDSAPAAPEPSALLVFGTGLLIAGAVTRRSR